MWKIEYYTEPSGRQPVAEWLDGLDKKTRDFILDKIDLMGLHGLVLLNTNMMRSIRGYGKNFYEIKYSNYRIVLYHDTTNQAFVLLHGFKKEHQRESKEIETAYSRLRKYISRRWFMARTFEDDLKRELQDPESARYFGAAHANSSFALTLALARKKLGVTQQELAEKAGVSQAYIAKLEGGEANPTLGRIGSLLAVLGLSLTTGVTSLDPYADREKLHGTNEPFLYPEAAAAPLAREKKAKYHRGSVKLKNQKSKIKDTD